MENQLHFSESGGEDGNRKEVPFTGGILGTGLPRWC